MTWLAQCVRFLARRSRGLRPAPRCCPRRPTLEALETRNVLSTLFVTNVSDTGVSGDGSLRGEIAAASPGDTIRFACKLGGQTITLDPSKGALVLSTSLTIAGPGDDRLTVSGGDATTVFVVNSGATDSISGLTIAHGHTYVYNWGTVAGGIANSGNLSLDHCTLSDNSVQADFSLANAGGVLNILGSLSLDHCTFSGNSVTGNSVNYDGGGIANFGGTVTIDHSTLCGNSVADTDYGGGVDGGGIVNFSGTVAIDHSTLCGNSTTECNGVAGGIANYSGTVTIDHSTLTGNHADDGLANGGAIANYSGTVTIGHSAVTGNYLENSPAGSGGILNDGALALSHSTVTGNSEDFGGTSYAADVFNLARVGATLSLDHSTVGALRTI